MLDLIPILILAVFDRLTRMADDLEDDVEKDDSGMKTVQGIFDSKPRTLSQVIAQAGRPLKKPQVLLTHDDIVEAVLAPEQWKLVF